MAVQLMAADEAVVKTWEHKPIYEFGNLSPPSTTAD